MLVVLATTAFIISLLIVPSWENVLGLVTGTRLVLAFALKDYGSCLLAGLATIFERTYQPGNWIEIGGAYGEVRSVGLRAVRLVTLDDTEIIVPHSSSGPRRFSTPPVATTRCCASRSFFCILTTTVCSCRNACGKSQ
jgi:small-conductance mechanosensitive channel